jgi:hypothetical protein
VAGVVRPQDAMDRKADTITAALTMRFNMPANSSVLRRRRGETADAKASCGLPRLKGEAGSLIRRSLLEICVRPRPRGSESECSVRVRLSMPLRSMAKRASNPSPSAQMDCPAAATREGRLRVKSGHAARQFRAWDRAAWHGFAARAQALQPHPPDGLRDSLNHPPATNPIDELRRPAQAGLIVSERLSIPGAACASHH